MELVDPNMAVEDCSNPKLARPVPVKVPDAIPICDAAPLASFDFGPPADTSRSSPKVHGAFHGCHASASISSTSRRPTPKYFLSAAGYGRGLRQKRATTSSFSLAFSASAWASSLAS